MKNEIMVRIYNLLQKSGLNWYGWLWWGQADEWFKQFDPAEIDNIAKEMADAGMIETDGRGGFRRKEKTLKEKIFLKIWGW